jgi:hypothetical protein
MPSTSDNPRRLGQALRNLAQHADSLVAANIFYAILSNFKITQAIAEADAKDYPGNSTKDLSEADLRKAFEDSVDRLRRIEDNSRATLVGATLAGALMGTSLNIFGPNGPATLLAPDLRTLAATLLLLAMFFLVASGIFALAGYQVGRVYRPRLESFGSTKIRVYLLIEYLHCIRQNDLIQLQRTNYLQVAFKCLRNGLVLLLLFHSLILIAAAG